MNEFREELNFPGIKYAPENEQGVVFLFAKLMEKVGFEKIVEIGRPFPDCTAINRSGKQVKIEFEYLSHNFITHKHNPKKCDCIICWKDDSKNNRKLPKIIELRKKLVELKFLSNTQNVWIVPIGKTWWTSLDKDECSAWSVAKEAKPGDLLLMYRTGIKQIKDIFEVMSEVQWKDNKVRWLADTKIVAHLKKNPLTMAVMRDTIRTKHEFLKPGSQALRSGRPCVTEDWNRLYKRIVKENPSLKKVARLAPRSIVND